jgi:Flp pilus assembly protein TadG
MMRERLSQFRRAFRRDRRGGAAAEFALILPTIGAMLLGALDMGNAWSTRLRLEQAAQAGIEMVANRQGFSPSYSFALAEATSRWGGPLTSATVENWLECDGVKQSSGATQCGSGEARARYVAIRMQAEFMPTLKLGDLITGDGPNGGFLILGDAAVRVQ